MKAETRAIHLVGDLRHRVQATSPRWREPLLLAVLSVVSATLLVRFGRVGFYYHDLSIIWDGAWRVLNGQIPAVDFAAPHAFAAIYQQAILFRLLGVSFATYLLHAILLNTVALFLSWRILRPAGLGIAFLGTLITSIWFFLPPGAPYIDTVAFFWCLVAVACVYWRGAPETVGRSGLLLAGLATGVAILTKQNIGVPAAIGIGAVILLVPSQDRGLRWLVYAAGVAVPVVSLVVYVGVNGGLGDLIHYSLRLPLADRSSGIASQLGYRLLNAVHVGAPRHIDVVAWAQESMLIGLGLLLAARFASGPRTLEGKLALLALVLFGVQDVARVTSHNEWPLYWVYAGLIASVMAFAFIPGRYPRLASLGVICLWLVGLGYQVSRTRLVMDIPVARATAQLQWPALRGLVMENDEQRSPDEVLEFITMQIPAEDPILIAGYDTIIYSLTGRQSTHPLLFPMPGWVNSPADGGRSDAKLLAFLESSPDLWVISRVDSLGDFLPRSTLYFQENFRVVADAGDLNDIYRRVP